MNSFLKNFIRIGTGTTRIILVTLTLLLVWIFSQFDAVNLFITSHNEFQVKVSRFEIFLIMTLLFLNVFVSYNLLRKFKNGSNVLKTSTSVIIFTLLMICVWIAHVFNFTAFAAATQSPVIGGVQRFELILLMILVLISIITTLRLFRKYNQADEVVIMSAYSKKVKYQGEWVSVEKFINEKLGVKISHGVTPDEKDKILQGFHECLEETIDTQGTDSGGDLLLTETYRKHE